jgi:hypothetical protein
MGGEVRGEGKNSGAHGGLNAPRVEDSSDQKSGSRREPEVAAEGHYRRRDFGDQRRWRGGAIASAGRGEDVDANNWECMRQIRSNRRRQWRRRRGWMPASVGRTMQGTRDPTKWS